MVGSHEGHLACEKNCQLCPKILFWKKWSRKSSGKTAVKMEESVIAVG